MGETTSERKIGFIRGMRAEFKKIIWPNFPSLMKQTGIVIVVSLLIGGIVTLIDMGYSAGIYQLLGK